MNTLIALFCASAVGLILGLIGRERLGWIGFSLIGMAISALGMAYRYFGGV